jgi:trigger factor
LKITTEDLGDRQVMLTIEVDEERVDRTLRGVARRISRNYNIPGFRRGRAPFHVILRRFGREALLQEALDDLGQEVIQEALEGEGLEPYDAGNLEDVQLDPLTFKLRVPLRPTVDLGDYHELRLEPPVVSVDEEEIDTELERLRQANAILEPAGDRPAQLGDWVSFDIHADVDDTPLVHKEDESIVLDAENTQFGPGFAEQIAGMTVDEKKEFTLTLGDDWGEDRAGQEAAFSVTLHELRSRMVPELDDDLARTVGDYDTLEELRLSIREQFEETAQSNADQEYSESVLQALIDGATIEYPPDLIENQIDGMADDLEERLESQNIVLDDYWKLTGQTEESFRESLEPQAESIVRRGLVLGEFARQEKLDVEGVEVEQRISLLSASWGERAGEVREMLSEPDSVRSITNSLLTDKAVQHLVAIAKGEAPSLEEEDDESSEGRKMLEEEGTETPEDESETEPEKVAETPDTAAGEPAKTE